MMRWLDKLPLVPLALGALVLGLAPLVPEPHLWSKLVMLAHGQLHRAIDIGDLMMHASLPVILILKIVRMMRIKGNG